MIDNSPIRWRNGEPYSEKFDDVYFSTENGLAETEYVFLQGNQLHQRWAALSNQSFTIIETGFGTGLNFLCSLEQWLSVAPHKSVLHYISIEKYPLLLTHLMQAHALWPRLAELAKCLHEVYAGFESGCNQVSLFDGRVELTLWFDDVALAVPKITQPADAWFLDGFAPAKNPDMWHSTLFHSMAKLSHNETTFATFTSAGNVRRGLIDAGFTVFKRIGYGKKREMLHGVFHQHTSRKQRKTETAIVIGAGIAGCASAYALAQRGIQVTVLEQHNEVAQEASGNALGVLYPRLIGTDVQSEFSLASFIFTLKWLAKLDNDNVIESGADYGQCGMLQLAHTARELARFQVLVRSQKNHSLYRFVNAAEASEIAGAGLVHDALHIPSAMWVKPRNLCFHLLEQPRITLKFKHSVTNLDQSEDGWSVTTRDGDVLHADTVIIANAYAARQLTVTAHIPLQAVRGQVSQLKATRVSSELRCILCSDGYLSPPVDGQHVLGASFVLDDTQTDIRTSEDASNMSILQTMSPTLFDALSSQLHGSRASIRCASPDHMPIVGALMHAQSLISSPPRYNASNASLPWLGGLYVNLAHGSKGLTSAPFCAELIAEMIAGETTLMEKRFIAAMNPNRFTLKTLGLKQLITTSAIR